MPELQATAVGLKAPQTCCKPEVPSPRTAGAALLEKGPALTAAPDNLLPGDSSVSALWHPAKEASLTPLCC